MQYKHHLVKNNEAVIDLTYRSAKCIEANNYTMDFDPNDYDIVNKITKHMGNVRIECDKLNICGVDDFFKVHKDTSKSLDMIGTLIVCLPSAFTGGKLLLHDNETITFPFKKQNVIQWCAFYSDIDYEILKVVTGNPNHVSC